MPLSVSNQVLRVLEGEDIHLPELDLMITHSAITSLREANRRYHHWLFEVDLEAGWVERMFKHVEGWETHHMCRVHSECNGDGCKDCGWSGELPCN